MVEPGCGDERSADFPFFPAINLAKKTRRRHHAYIHWKIRACKLALQNLFEAVATEMLGLETVKMKTILGFVERLEEWDALNVVPMVMRNEDMRFDPAVTVPLR